MSAGLLAVLALTGMDARAELDPDPAVLRVGPVSVVATDIFTPEETRGVRWPLGPLRRAMNAIHTGTRESVIRRELLFAPGDTLRAEVLRESERNLRAAGYLNDVAVVPLDTLADGSVPLEVRVRETWSLSTQFSYSKASTGDRWSFMLGSRWMLRLLNVEQSDGARREFVLGRPFYRQDASWGGELRTWSLEYEPRWYLCCTGPAGASPAGPRLYTQFPLVDEGLELSWLRRVTPEGRGRLLRVGAGLRVRRRDFRTPVDLELSDGRVVDASVLTDPRDSALRREQGTTVLPFLALATEGRRWDSTRYLLRYGPIEDVPLDPFGELRVGYAPVVLGSRIDRLWAEIEARDWSRLASGHLLLRLDGRAGLGGPAARNWDLDLTAGWLRNHGDARLTRIFAEAAWGEGLLGHEAFVLGLTRGVRTLEYDGMAGDRLLRWNLEHSVLLPVEPLGLYRLGIAAFTGGGVAWWRGEPRGLRDARHEAGVGLRIGATRSGLAEVARLDLSWALDTDEGPVVTATTTGLF